VLGLPADQLAGKFAKNQQFKESWIIILLQLRSRMIRQLNLKPTMKLNLQSCIILQHYNTRSWRSSSSTIPLRYTITIISL
jgi:hypothetical protein